MESLKPQWQLKIVKEISGRHLAVFKAGILSVGKQIIGLKDKTFARIIDLDNGEHVAVFCENIVIEGRQYMTKAIVKES